MPHRRRALVSRGFQLLDPAGLIAAFEHAYNYPVQIVAAKRDAVRSSLGNADQSDRQSGLSSASDTARVALHDGAVCAADNALAPGLFTFAAGGLGRILLPRQRASPHQRRRHMKRTLIASAAFVMAAALGTPALAADTVEMTWMSIANWYFKIG